MWQSSSRLLRPLRCTALGAGLAAPRTHLQPGSHAPCRVLRSSFWGPAHRLTRQAAPNGACSVAIVRLRRLCCSAAVKSEEAREARSARSGPPAFLEKRQSEGQRVQAPVKRGTVKPRFGSKASRRAYAERNAAGTERLSKVMAAAGVASRRACEEIIFAGRVTVNGVKTLLPQTQVDPRKDSVYVDGRQLPKSVEKLYFVMNKPKGFICSNDPGGHRLVVDLFQDWATAWASRHPGLPVPRLYTVGRLDVATSGLLLLTNDGDFMQRVAHPSSGVTKEYIVATEEAATRRQLQAIAEGTVVDGVQVVPLSVAPIDNDPLRGGSRYAIEVAEGRNHEVRKLVAAAGLTIRSLKRTRIGGMRLPRDLLPGQFRPLTPKELASITGKK